MEKDKTKVEDQVLDDPVPDFGRGIENLRKQKEDASKCSAEQASKVIEEDRRFCDTEIRKLLSGHANQN